jgi:hypothetical protein
VARALGADNRRWSQAFAKAHSRSTVAGDIPSAVAASSIVSPAKESQLHDPALPGIDRGHRIERLVECQHVHARCPRVGRAPQD